MPAKIEKGSLFENSAAPATGEHWETLLTRIFHPWKILLGDGVLGSWRGGLASLEGDFFGFGDTAPNPRCFYGAGDSTAKLQAELKRMSIKRKISWQGKAVE